MVSTLVGVVACAAALLSAPAARAQDELKIAAVVNDDVITQLDVYMRLRLAMLSARLQDTPEQRQKLLPQIMRTLIDDHLKIQEAKAQGVTVGDGDVNSRIDNLAKRNGLTRQDFEAMLASNGVLVQALADQMRADVGWNRLVQRKLRPTIRITDEEINEAMARDRAALGKLEYHLSQIFLAVDAPKDMPAVQQSAQRLLEQLQAGADFASLATQFSQDTSAAVGGDIGWVRADEVDPALARELEQLGQGGATKGKLLGPIQAVGGIVIDRVEDVRTANLSSVAPGSVHLVQLIWPLASNAADKEVDAAQQQADTFAGTTRTCQEFQAAAPPGANFRDFGRVALDDMPPEIREIATNQPIGAPTKGIRGDGGIAVFVICDRGDSNGQISRVAIADRLAQERLETLARGYLSDLRRAAYIDIRL
ncbi:MAG TPA: peptidylprolyl isomerase [Dongiaceae bacterium]|nr:peptidylprolyl isomerase [Dongiaceae bacterium]